MMSAGSRSRQGAGGGSAPSRTGARRIGVSAFPAIGGSEVGGPARVEGRARVDEADVAEGVVGRERVAELQRARIIVAMGELVHERGVGGVAVAHVVARSGISRRTFYEIFADRDACLLAAFDYAVERAAAVVVPAYEVVDGGGWEERIRAGLLALLVFLEEEPALGGLLVVDALAERHMLEHRQQIVELLIDTVHRDARVCRSPGGGVRVAASRSGVGSPSGRSAGGGRGRQRRIVAEGLVGAVLAVIHARLLARDSESLRGLLNPLMATIVLPYLGPAAAERELQRPRPRSRPRAATPADPLREIDMRLTYRTVRVLLAIAAHPAASGRQVADASGIADQGQMSKLLSRLRHLGLIHNTAGGHGKGEPNAWTLTPTGKDIARAIRTQTGD